MLSLQGKVGQVVVKVALFPTVGDVAFITGLQRIELLVDLADVRILMAVYASLSQTPEGPAVVL